VTFDFNFPAPTPQDLFPDVVEAVMHFGLFEPVICGWLADKIAEHWNDDYARIFPLKYQDEIVKNARCDYVKAVQGMELTIRRAVERWRLAKEYARSRSDIAIGLIFAAAEINTRSPRVCCDHARALDGVMFTKAQQLPTLPLPLCEFEFCGCDYRVLTHAEYEKRLRDHS